MILYENIITNNKIMIWTLHLKSRSKNRSMREEEITEYLTVLNEFLDEIKQDEIWTKAEIDSLPIIITGDFNDVPDSSVVQTMFDTKKTNGLIFKSAYCIDGVYPEFSNYWYRPEYTVRQFIDFIFYRDVPTLKLISIRDLPSEDEIPKDTANPCNKCPSDHFSLAATFEIS